MNAKMGACPQNAGMLINAITLGSDGKTADRKFCVHEYAAGAFTLITTLGKEQQREGTGKSQADKAAAKCEPFS